MHTIYKSKDHRGREHVTVIFDVEDSAKDYKAAVLKYDQLEREIRDYTESVQQTNLLHSLSKLWTFLMEFVPPEIVEAE